tara:strand:+ start:705 stop:1121 length:417 start_codon:yes stop_codon:yes gene_type:complete
MNNNTTFEEKLRSSGLRPTQQRIKICKTLFDRKKTFHFTIKELSKIILNQFNSKISLATVYNTVNAFKKKGYLKVISINCEKNYYDTNVTNHHHFYDESKNELIDLNDSEVGQINIKRKIPGKKVNSVEVLVKISNNN